MAVAMISFHEGSNICLFTVVHHLGGFDGIPERGGGRGRAGVSEGSTLVRMSSSAAASIADVRESSVFITVG